MGEGQAELCPPSKGIWGSQAPMLAAQKLILNSLTNHTPRDISGQAWPPGHHKGCARARRQEFGPGLSSWVCVHSSGYC